MEFVLFTLSKLIDSIAFYTTHTQVVRKTGYSFSYFCIGRWWPNNRLLNFFINVDECSHTHINDEAKIVWDRTL